MNFIILGNVWETRHLETKSPRPRYGHSVVIFGVKIFLTFFFLVEILLLFIYSRIKFICTGELKKEVM